MRHNLSSQCCVSKNNFVPLLPYVPYRAHKASRPCLSWHAPTWIYCSPQTSPNLLNSIPRIMILIPKVDETLFQIWLAYWQKKRRCIVVSVSQYVHSTQLRSPILIPLLLRPSLVRILSFSTKYAKILTVGGIELFQVNWNSHWVLPRLVSTL